MSIKISDLLKTNTCTILKNKAKPIVDGNSSFVSLPVLKLAEIFSDFSKVEVSANFVHIDG